MSEHLDFSLSLHAELPAESNYCWSPYSIASALGLIATAAGGATRDEIVRLLRSGTGDDLLKLLSAAAEVGDGDNGPVFSVANTLWAHENLPLRESYLRALSSWPGSAVRNAPFRSAPDRARQEINADVAETTRGLIPELLKPGTVDPDTVAALVNALYLKASWTQCFDQHATADEVFHAPAGDRDVPTMHVTRQLGYAKRDGWQVVSIPAAGGVEAVVLLPEGNLGSAEAQLSSSSLSALIAAAVPQQVALALPKFEVTGEVELQSPLGALGVHTMFTSEADFSSLTGESLRVSAMVHQSVLRVDENGLEGAAATAAVMRLTAIIEQPKPIRVEVNRPFLFLVRHRETGALYFLARVANPI